jgi:SSS family solute:Na+ symporter
VFATKNVGDARRGLILSGLSILIAGVYASAIGLSVRAAHPGLANSQQAAGWLITQLPSALLVIYGAFLVATIVSASGSCLQSVVTNVVHDLYGSTRRRSRSPWPSPYPTRSHGSLTPTPTPRQPSQLRSSSATCCTAEVP